MKVVVIGGGHGQKPLLRALKKLNVELSSIVTVSDDGGSTGRIRKLYPIPAMGDIRSVIVALASDQEIVTKLLDFRFTGDYDQDVVGHNLGNLILTALTSITGSFDKAIDLTCKTLDIKAKIIPSSLEVLDLYARMDDGTIVKGESNIPRFHNVIEEVFYDQKVVAHKPAIDAILEADYIIYGIGSLFTSVLPNLIIPEINQAIKESKAKKIYFCNCMTQNFETYNYDVKRHVSALQRHGCDVDLVIKHNDEIPENIRELYLAEKAIEVLYHNDLNTPVLEKDLLSFKNNLVRHDEEKVYLVLKEILNVV